MHQINPHPISVGHAGDGRAFTEIFAKEIRAIVQIAADEPALAPPRDLILCRFPLLDGTGNDADVLHLAITSVVNLLKLGIPTLVCCGAGMSRSPAIVAAGLALAHNLDLDDCLKQVAACRPVDLSAGFLSEVREVVRKEGALSGEQSRSRAGQHSARQELHAQ